MKRQFTLALWSLTAFSGMAGAQDNDTAHKDFVAADNNGDGVLSEREIKRPIPQGRGIRGGQRKGGPGLRPGGTIGSALNPALQLLWQTMTDEELMRGGV